MASSAVSLLRTEIFLAYAANWANPILGDVFKSCSRLYAIVGIAYFWVIHITAGLADVLFHKLNCFV